MKNIDSRGFTLIELVAIVALLSIIFLVSFPQFQSTIKKDQEKEYDNFITTLCESVKEYVYNSEDAKVYKDMLNTGETADIKVDRLINYDIIDPDMTNPKTGESINSGNVRVKFETDGMLTCEYVE